MIPLLTVAFLSAWSSLTPYNYVQSVILFAEKFEMLSTAGFSIIIMVGLVLEFFLAAVITLAAQQRAFTGLT